MILSSFSKPHFKLFSILLFVCAGLTAQAATDLVANPFPPIIQGSPSSDDGLGVAIDPIGNKFVVGSFLGVRDFKPSVGIDERTSAGLDGFVTRINADDSYIWTVTFGGPGIESITSVLLAKDGQTLYVAGETSSTSIMFNGVNYTPPSTRSSVFVLALDPVTGSPKTNFGTSGVQFLGSSGSTDETFFKGLALTPDKIFVSGSFNGTALKIVGTGASVASTGFDAYVASLNTSNGSADTSFGLAGSGIQVFGGSGDEDGGGMAVSGNVLYAVGNVRSADAQIGGTGPSPAVDISASDAFIIALNATTGAAMPGFGQAGSGVQVFGGSVEDNGKVVVVSGNIVYLIGDTNSSNGRIGTSGPIVATAGSIDVFICALDAVTGAPVTSFGLASSGVQLFGGFREDYARAAISAGHTLYVGAQVFSADARIGASGPTQGSLQNDISDAFLIALNPASGAAVVEFGIAGSGMQKYGGSLNEDLSGIALRNSTIIWSGATQSTNGGIGGPGTFDATDFGGYLVTTAAALYAPHDIALAPATIPEFSPVGTIIGVLSSTDIDSQGPFVFSFATSRVSDNAAFTLSGNTLKSAVVFDAAVKSTYSVAIRSLDKDNLAFDKSLTVTIQPVPNSAPAGLNLSNTTIPDGSPAATVVGTFMGIDPDPSTIFTYALVPGIGDTDNALFSVTGNVLNTAAPVDFNLNNTFSIRARTTDNRGLTFERLFVLTVQAAPNSGGGGVINVGTGTVVKNPVDGISLTVVSSEGGLIQLSIDADELANRALLDVNTEWGDIAGRQTVVRGLTPAHKYRNRGIFIVKSTATDRATGIFAGRARKTLPISAKETGETVGGAADERGILRALGDPPSNAMTTKTLKGKFVFGAGKNDAVTYVGTIKLPANLDITKTHEMSFAAGNIVVNATIDEKGKGVEIGGTGVMKSLKIRYKVRKNSGLTKGGEDATVTAVFSAKGLVDAGFDTEGITTRSTDVGPGKSGPRSIQVAMLLDGVPYESSVPVTFAIAKDSEFGSIKGR